VDLSAAMLRQAARVSQAVQAALEPHVTPDGVLLGSRAWLVTASRPWQ
jgi:hypothetical protein